MTTILIDPSLTAAEMRQHRAAGETLLLEGEMPAGVYSLHSGEVDLLFAARNGDMRPLRVATSGQILGLSAVLTSRPHECSAITRVPCEVGFIPRDEFLRVLEEHPSVWFSVLRILSNDVNGVYDNMRDSRSGDVRHTHG